MDTLPTPLFLTFFLLLGVIVGSFLNVVAYRFHTGKSLNGRSHCLSCGGRLSWYELVPIVSYTLQLGACGNCRARISPQYVLVELATGLLFLLVGRLFYTDVPFLVLHLGVVSLLVVITVYDLRHFIIPDELVLYLTALALAIRLWDPIARAVVIIPFDGIVGGLVPAGFFAGLWYISHGRWIGLGDAKLALPLGLVVGLWGSISVVLFSFWIGAIVSVGLLLVQRISKRGVVFSRRSLTTASEDQGTRSPVSYPSTGVAKHQRCFTMKSEVPFAPFLVCAFLLVAYAGADAFAVVDTVLAYLF
ncbi:prepilin peptidase [Candidatus Kaiserbacteria bacterium]|nr:prepilin peptidase [Candidatus Kaiserbacteria bacterium]